MAHRCSVCALPSDVLNHGEQLIVKGKEYREVAALCPSGPSKSSWFRHMQNCYRARRFYGIGQRAGKEAFRLITEWPNGKLTLDGQPFTTTFRQGDVVLRVEYMQTEPQELHNPKSLVNERLIDEATREYLALFPDAKFAEAEAPAVEGVSEANTNRVRISESILAVAEVGSDAAPCEVTSSAVTAKSPTVGDLPNDCQHIMTRVSGDIARCQFCGHQEQPPVIVGVSRAWYDKQHNRRSPLRGLGRFG